MCFSYYVRYKKEYIFLFGPKGLRTDNNGTVVNNNTTYDSVKWQDILNKPTTFAGLGLPLTSDDLPSVPWAKISDAPQFLTSVSWSDIAGKPTTFAGLGLPLTSDDLPRIPWNKLIDIPSTVGTATNPIAIFGNQTLYKDVLNIFQITTFDLAST